MKRVEDECVHCDMYCLGSICPNRNVERYYCDECDYEDVLYDYYGQELCAECLLKKFEIIEGSK